MNNYYEVLGLDSNLSVEEINEILEDKHSRALRILNTAVYIQWLIILATFVITGGHAIRLHNMHGFFTFLFRIFLAGYGLLYSFTVFPKKILEPKVYYLRKVF